MNMLAAMSWGQWFLGFVLMCTCLLLILVILLQRGRGGGLAGAFGGSGGTSAFGAKTGDVFTWITVVGATLVILLSIVTNFVYDESGEPRATASEVEVVPVTQPTTPPPGGAEPVIIDLNEQGQIIPPSGEPATGAAPAGSTTPTGTGPAGTTPPAGSPQTEVISLDQDGKIITPTSNGQPPVKIERLPGPPPEILKMLEEEQKKQQAQQTPPGTAPAPAPGTAAPATPPKEEKKPEGAATP